MHIKNQPRKNPAPKAKMERPKIEAQGTEFTLKQESFDLPGGLSDSYTSLSESPVSKRGNIVMPSGLETEAKTKKPATLPPHLLEFEKHLEGHYLHFNESGLQDHVLDLLQENHNSLNHFDFWKRRSEDELKFFEKILPGLPEYGRSQEEKHKLNLASTGIQGYIQYARLFHSKKKTPL